MSQSIVSSALTREQALNALRSDDVIGLGMEAELVRLALHPEGVATYAMERVMDYAVLSADAVVTKLRDAIEFGATGVVLESATLPAHPVATYVELLKAIRGAFPELTICAFAADEIAAIAAISGQSVREVLIALKAAGLDMLAAGGAAIPDVEARRAVAERGLDFATYLDVHRTAHGLKIPTAAGLLFGKGETFAERIDRLFALRDLQAETGGFISVTPWHYQPAVKSLDEATTVEYLKTLAVTRLVIDNVPNVVASWATQGLKVLELALHFGANDAGSVLIEDDLRAALGRAGRTTEEDLRRIIRDAGLRPARRDALYRTLAVE